jgi:hypothetical protein
VAQAAQGGCAGECPGCGGARATCSGGALEGGGRIDPQTFIATYSEVAFAPLSERKPSRTAAEPLRAQGGPSFATPDVPLRPPVTDRATEGCGRPDTQAEEWYWAGETIDHPRPQGKSPQPTGLGERSHQARLNASSRSAFGKEIDTPPAALQAGWEGGRSGDHEHRGPRGRGGAGRPPGPPFVDTMPVAKEQ